MKGFFKILFASTLGVFLAIFLFFAVFAGIIGSISSMTNKTVIVEPNSILKLSFDKSISERAGNNFTLNSLISDSYSSIGLNDILNSLKRAKEDDNIKGLCMDFNSSLLSGYATIDEIRDAILDFKQSGKFVLSYSDTYNQSDYYLASAGDKIYMTPSGSLSWNGVGSQVMFYKGLMDKLDVEMQIIRHGKFKSAVEPYILTEMSPENREQMETLLYSIWGSITKKVSESRNISVEKLNQLADNVILFNDKDAYENKLIDAVLYRDEYIDELKAKMEVEKEDDLNFISCSDYASSPKTNLNKIEKDKIAIVYAYGDVIDGEGRDGEVSSITTAKAMRDAREDENVKAIVFRINSPGGSALASEVIYREVLLAAQSKPVIASFGDYAASGGYYIAAACNAIVAQPTTLTGSIGVFGTIPYVGKAMKNKLGITVSTVRTNDKTDAGSLFRPLTEAEKAIVQRSVENTYDTFITHVSEGRNMSKEDVDEIGQGRVWSGIDGYRLNLVDELGGIQKAIDMAASKANIENYRIAEFPVQKTLFEQMAESFDIEVIAQKIRWGEMSDTYSYIKKTIEQSGIQARLEQDIIIR